MRWFPDLPPVWLALHLVAAWALGAILPVFPLPLPVWPGVVLMLAGVGLVLWSQRWFRAKRTTINPTGTPSALIVEGPYRLTRNPIYLGMLLVLFGFGVTQAALSALLPALVFAPLITARFIRREEAGLRQLFGAGAEAYFARTRRWL